MSDFLFDACVRDPYQAMLQSVRGLRQSAALCGPEELPLTVDLLQGSEAVAAVLSRSVDSHYLNNDGVGAEGRLLLLMLSHKSGNFMRFCFRISTP